MYLAMPSTSIHIGVSLPCSAFSLLLCHSLFGWLVLYSFFLPPPIQSFPNTVVVLTLDSIRILLQQAGQSPTCLIRPAVVEDLTDSFLDIPINCENEFQMKLYLYLYR